MFPYALKQFGKLRTVDGTTIHRSIPMAQFTSSETATPSISEEGFSDIIHSSVFPAVVKQPATAQSLSSSASSAQVAPAFPLCEFDDPEGDILAEQSDDDMFGDHFHDTP